MSSDELIEFINSLYKTNDSISLHEPFFNDHDIELVKDCINSSYVSSNGDFLIKFENEIKKITGAKHAILCVNGTSALHLACLACGINKDHEVITQSLTFTATLNAISYVGARALLFDVNKTSLGIDPKILEAWLNENTDIENGYCINKNTKKRIHACIPMHTFGNPSDIEEISRICKTRNICIIEDCAESLGSFYDSKHTGLFGKMGVLSFNGNKIITTGGGGAIITDDDQLASYCRHIGTTAKQIHEYEFLHTEVGYNYRMPNINAALGCAQINRLDSYLSSKREIFKKYINFFSNYQHGEIFKSEDNKLSNNWLITAIYNSSSKRDRDLKKLIKNKIFCRIPWRPMHLLNIHKASIAGDSLDNTMYIYRHALNLPSSPII